MLTVRLVRVVGGNKVGSMPRVLNRGLVSPNELRFLFLVEELGLGTSNYLLGFVIAQGLFTTYFTFSEDETFFLSEFDRRIGLEQLTTGSYKEVPLRRLIVLSNNSIITRLLTRLNSAAQIAFKSVQRYVLPDGSNPPDGHSIMKVGVIESHFHLDCFSSRHITTLSDLTSSVDLPINLMFAVQNNVYPGKWAMFCKQVASIWQANPN